MADAPEQTDTINVELTDADSGETLWSAQLVWKGGTDQAVPMGAPPIDLDDPNQKAVAVQNIVWEPKFEALQTEFKATRDASPTAAGGLDVAKFAWEIIKDSKPVTQTSGAFTAVLSTGDKKWDHYSNAKEFKSRTFDWRGKNLFGMTLYSAKHTLRGTFQATYSGTSKDVPKGKYLPLIFFDIPEAFAAITWSLSGSGTSSNPSNMGAPNDVVPMVYIAAKFTANGWFQSFSKSFTYKVRGDVGYVKG